MTEISENVYAQAKRVVRSADFTTITITELVAQAIKVERARCEQIVRRHIEGISRVKSPALPVEIVAADYVETLTYVIEGLEPQAYVP